MSYEWFVMIDGVKQGPFTKIQLRNHPRITPDSLVWRHGFSIWLPIRKIKELEDLYKDIPKPSSNQPEEGDGIVSVEASQSPATLTMRFDPFQFFIFAFLVLLLAIFLYIRLHA